MQGLDQFAELQMLMPAVGMDAIVVVRRKKTERHVAPVVVLLRIELKHGHQFNGGDAQLSQIGDLVNDSCERPAPVRRDPGILAVGKAADVHLVDDQVGLVPQGRIASPIEGRLARIQNGQRSAAPVRTRPAGRLAVKGGGKMHVPRVRVQQQLLRVKRMPLDPRPGLRTVDLIGIELGAGQRGLRDPAVPDRSGLVPQMLKVVPKNRRHEVVLEEYQRDLFGMLGIERKVVGFLGRDPSRAERGRRTFGGFPADHAVSHNSETVHRDNSAAPCKFNTKAAPLPVGHRGRITAFGPGRRVGRIAPGHSAGTCCRLEQPGLRRLHYGTSALAGHHLSRQGRS